MARTLITLLAIIAARTAQSEAQLVERRPLAITTVTVVDVSARTAAGALKPNQTVILRDGRIASVADSNGITLPPDARRIDGAGKYLIPGLWDMHAHLLGRDKRDSFLPLYVVNGVTAVRDMHTDVSMEEITNWRRDIAAGSLISPRLAAVAGHIMSGPGSRMPPQMQIATRDEARLGVVARKNTGVDFIKVGSLLPREAYFAIAAESRAQKLPFVGHVTGSVTVAEALQAGQLGIEHAGHVLVATSAREDALMQQALTIDQTRTPFVLSRVRIDAEARRTYDERKGRALADLFRSKGATLVPTLVQRVTWPYLRSGALPYATWLKYMPGSFTRTWQNGNVQFGNPTDDDFAQAEANADKLLELVGMMHRSGVSVLAGTDANGGFIGLIPGISLHHELALLVQAGLTPLEALRSATIAPATFLNAANTTGTIEPRKTADLVLLDANPLQEIGNTQRIAAVVVEGRLYDRDMLDQMLARLAAAASAH